MNVQGFTEKTEKSDLFMIFSLSGRFPSPAIPIIPVGCASYEVQPVPSASTLGCSIALQWVPLTSLPAPRSVGDPHWLSAQEPCGPRSRMQYLHAHANIPHCRVLRCAICTWRFCRSIRSHALYRR